LKNAAFLHVDHDLAAPAKTHGGRHPIPDPAIFEEKLRSIGLFNNSRVIIYDDGDNNAAGRLWWMLKYYGLQEVFVLEGGFVSLMEEDLTREQKEFSRGDITLNPQKSMTASYEEVLAYAQGDIPQGQVVIDSRSAERWRGEVEPVDPVAGHIPHTRNVFFRQHFDAQNHLLPLEQLKTHFGDLLEKEIILHCGSGVTACTNTMVLDELGKSSRLYVGSYSDYVSYPENMVVKE
jgi:thiosulfate/3-mercaptopyruvate sulfurtransferase